MAWLKEQCADGSIGKRLLAVLPGGHGHFEEWVEGAPMPFDQMVTPHGAAIAALLGRLHALPPPAEMLGGETRFWADMQAWASALPEAWAQRPTTPGKARLLAEVSWLREGGLVGPSPLAVLHKDVHGANLLVLPSGDLQLIDLEFADVGPRAFDVATFFLECAFVEADERWDWSRVPTDADQAAFARAYSRVLAVDASEETVASTAQALLNEWAAGWGLVAHVWNVLWALTTAAAETDVGVGGFDYLEYACLRWERYLHEKRAASN
jgi:thiamine kinase-like enzyme